MRHRTYPFKEIKEDWILDNPILLAGALSMAKKKKVKKKCCHKFEKKGKYCKKCPESIQLACEIKAMKKKK